MIFRPGTASDTEPSGPVGQRSVVLSGRTRKYLKNPKTRYIGQEIAAHEMRHVYQPDALYQTGGDTSLTWAQRPAEQDAEAFAHGVMRRVKKDHRQQMKRRVKKLPGQNPTQTRWPAQ
jgi:hypothetical protein